MLAEDVDPRFDPRFQRGFDPVRHQVTATPPPGMVATADAEPIRQREPQSDVAETEPETEPETDDVAEFPVARRRDPFATALPILGGVCLAVTGWLSWRYFEITSLRWSGQYRDADWVETAGPSLTMGLLAAGLFAIIGWLALRSLRSRG